MLHKIVVYLTIYQLSTLTLSYIMIKMEWMCLYNLSEQMPS